MSKYDRLGRHLSGLDRSRGHTLRFDRIEGLLGFALPKSATIHQAWWANQKNGRHVQANAWLNEGWVTEDLSLARRTVSFRPTNLPREPQAVRKPGKSIQEAKRAVAMHYGVRPDQVEITIRS